MLKLASDIINRISTVVLGKTEPITLALTCLFAGGHLLIEDIPGIGKTTLARGLAAVLGLDYKRIQFTNDLLPADIIGFSMPDAAKTSFVFHPGPVFTHILLADEINRATPRSQSALLEAMEEKQVTVDGQTRRLPRPFFVIATQNPQDQSGTYPLPDSQLDRFLMRIDLGYPSRTAEKTLLAHGETRTALAALPALLNETAIRGLQQNIAAVHAAPAILEYILDLLTFTRTSPLFVTGLSPRAGLSLLAAARAWAWLQERDYLVPDDVQAVAPWVMSHRLRARLDYGNISAEKLQTLLLEIPIP